MITFISISVFAISLFFLYQLTLLEKAKNTTLKALLFISTVLVWLPLTIFLGYHFLHIHISLTSILGALACLSLLSFYLIPPSRLSLIPKPALNTPKPLLIILIASSVVFLLPYLKHQTILGGDSSYYLKNSARIIASGQIPNNSTRNLILIFPVITSLVFHISLESSLILLNLILFISLGIITFILSRNYLSSQLSTLVVFLTLVNWGTLRLSRDLYSTFFALIIFFLILTLLVTSHKKLKKSYLLTFLFFSLTGSLFNLHGIVALGVLPIIFILTLVSFFPRPRLKRITISFFIAISTIYVCGLPFTQESFGILNRVFFQPIYSQVTSSPSPSATKTNSTPASTQTPASKPPTPPRQQIMGQVPRLPLTSFPARKQTLQKIAPILLYPIFFLGLIFLLYNSKNHKKNFYLFITATSFFLLTQQDHIGFSWIPSRFAMSLPPLFYLVVVYYLFFILQKKLRPKTSQSLTTFTLILLTATHIFQLIQSLDTEFNPTISVSEHHFYSTISVHASHPVRTVFSNSRKPEWLIGLNSTLKIYQPDQHSLCGDNSILEIIPPEFHRVGLAFTDKLTLQDSIDTFLQAANAHQYYVYLDLKNPCRPYLSHFKNHFYSVLVETPDHVLFIKNLN